MQYRRNRKYTNRYVKPLNGLKDAFGRIVVLAIVLPLSILFMKAIPFYLVIVEYLIVHTFIAMLVGLLITGILFGIGIFAKRKKQERYMMIQKFNEILKLNWREFEEFIEAILIDRGFNTILGAGTKDGGIDITAKFEGRTYLIQCKHYNDFKKVTVEQVREFYGVMNHIDSTAKGIFVTTGELTKEANIFAEQEDIEVWDKFYFLDTLKEINVENKPKAQTEGTHGTCEKCGGKMLLRTAHRGMNAGSQFLGCENYPKCTFSKR